MAVINTKKYIENFLYIKKKDSSMSLLKINEPQQMFYDVISRQASAGKPQRVIVLKARQQGISTVTSAIIFKKTATKFNTSSAVVAHDQESTNKIFGMYKLYYEMLQENMKPSLKNSNAKEVVFGDLRSGIRCMTAGSDGVGRGSTIQNLHLSELAFWGNNKAETYNGLVQAVPNTPDSLIVIESTANGFELFKELWDKAVAGESDFYPLFIPWFKLSEYRMKADGIILTEEEKKLKEQFDLDDEQIAWRRWCLANNCAGDLNKFHQEYPATPEEAFISTGTSYFDKEIIVKRIEQIRNVKPLKSGFFSYRKVIKPDGTKELQDVKFNEVKSRSDALIRIYEEPISSHFYVVGGDTAGEGSDKFTGQMIDNITGKQVAVLERSNIDDDEYAEQMVCLGRYYNNALISIEVNFNAYATRNIELMEYDNQYVRENMDTMGTQYQKKYGFKTTSITRPQILSDLKIIVRENIELINDMATLNEMLTFIVNDNGRAEAMVGKHDDLVMALAIAYGTRWQQKNVVEEVKPKSNNWLWEDLEEDEEEREWGDY